MDLSQLSDKQKTALRNVLVKEAGLRGLARGLASTTRRLARGVKSITPSSQRATTMRVLRNRRMIGDSALSVLGKFHGSEDLTKALRNEARQLGRTTPEIDRLAAKLESLEDSFGPMHRWDETHRALRSPFRVNGKITRTRPDSVLGSYISRLESGIHNRQQLESLTLAHEAERLSYAKRLRAARNSTRELRPAAKYMSDRFYDATGQARRQVGLNAKYRKVRDVYNSAKGLPEWARDFASRRPLTTAGILGAGSIGLEAQLPKLNPGSKPEIKLDESTETPGAETTGVETTGVETPGVETPGVETPGVETPGVETPGAGTPAGAPIYDRLLSLLGVPEDKLPLARQILAWGGGSLLTLMLLKAIF